MRLAGLAFVLVVASPAVAAAHIQLDYPLPRTTQQKQPNCGVTGSTRSLNPTVLEPGATITVRWTETINHPGHYRISFDADGEDFYIPLAADDIQPAGTNNILIDGIADVATPNSTYSAEITLPDQPCENCTLQLIQMMTDKPPYGDGNDIYYLCADIALRPGGAPGPDAGADNPAGPDAGADPGGPTVPSEAIGGCSATGARQGGWLVLLIAGLLVGARRWRGSDAH